MRTIGFLPLLAIFYGYTAGGPFGYEEIFSKSGPGMALVFLTFVPLFWICLFRADSIAGRGPLLEISGDFSVAGGTGPEHFY